MVVDAVISHWVTVVAPTEEGIQGLGLSIRYLVTYFYADDGLVALTQPERLHREFDVLTGLFDQVGLRMNTRKTVIIACQTCHMPGRMSVEAYERRTTGIRPTFWERQRRRVECPECRVEVAAGSLLTKCQSQHGVGQGERGGSPPPWGGPNLPGLFPEMSVAAPVPDRGVPGWGIKSDQPPGSIFTPPRAGHNRDPGGG